MTDITELIDRELHAFTILENTKTKLFIKSYKENHYKIVLKKGGYQYTFDYYTILDEDSITPYDIISSFLILQDIDYKTFCNTYQIKDKKLYNFHYKKYKRLHKLYPNDELYSIVKK